MKLLIVVFAAVCAFSSAEKKLPDYIKSCNLKSPDFDKCALQHANDAIPYIARGDKKLGIPVLDPLKLPLIDVVQNQFKLSLKDVVITGLKDIKATYLDLKPHLFDANFYIDNLVIVGNHAASGKVLLLNIEGKGRANITAIGGNYRLKADLTEYTKNGEKFLKFNKPTIEIDLKRAYFHFDNLLNGDQTLTSEVNKVLNDNWQDVLKDVGAPIRETISIIIESIVSNILDKVPATEIFQT